MNQEEPTKKLPRPDLRINPRKWSGAQQNNLPTRIAIFTTVSAVLAGMALIFVYPYFNIDRFRKIQKVNRVGINPEDVQPAGLPVWRDPFDRKKAD